MRGLLGSILLSALILAVLTSAVAYLARPRIVDFGVTFSTIRAAQLDLDVGVVWAAILDDLGVKKIRLPLYWSEIERKSGELDWSQIDELLDGAGDRQAKVVLAIGLKAPRWPECFTPDWTQNLSADERDLALLNFMRVAVLRYRDHSALDFWQVENEPFFSFGECPPPNLARYLDEVALLRELDPNHQVMATTSGEQSWWSMNAWPADILGFTLYRRVANPVFGDVVFPQNELFYLGQKIMTQPFVHRVLVSELQGEAWNDRRDYEAFSVNDLLANAEFARRTGVDEAYWWGTEWWYYLKERGDNRLWQAARELMGNNAN